MFGHAMKYLEDMKIGLNTSTLMFSSTYSSTFRKDVLLIGEGY
jgi:hypothetical protein